MAKSTRIKYDPPKQGWIVERFDGVRPVLVLSQTAKTAEISQHQHWVKDPKRAWSGTETRKYLKIYDTFDEARQAALAEAELRINAAQSELDRRKSKKQKIAQLKQPEFPPYES